MADVDKGPYSLDEAIVTHRQVTTKTIVNTSRFDSLLEDLEESFEYEIGYVPAGYEHRPDLISNIFYGTPKNWWLLMLVNNIEDPFEGFNVQDRIVIPRIT
tara:strand:+ start:4733 stop:5035 length:303 start_codon:yes stop_codon:yes gene_type:complete